MRRHNLRGTTVDFDVDRYRRFRACRQSLPSRAKEMGLQYFLEVFIARQFLEGREGNEALSIERQVSRLMQYATTGA